MLVWLQVGEDLTLELRWVCSEENWAADSSARPEHTEHARLSLTAFDRLWKAWGGVRHGLDGNRRHDQATPYSRFQTNNTAGVDVIKHNMMSNIPGPLQKYLATVSLNPP